MQSPYEILGVSPKATIDECRKAAKKLSIKNHPDNGGDPDAFIQIQDALKQIEQGVAVSYVSPARNKSGLTHINLVDIGIVA